MSVSGTSRSSAPKIQTTQETDKAETKSTEGAKAAGAQAKTEVKGDTSTKAKEPPRQSKMPGPYSYVPAPEPGELRPKARPKATETTTTAAPEFKPTGMLGFDPKKTSATMGEQAATMAGITKDQPVADLLAAAKKRLKTDPSDLVGLQALSYAAFKDKDATLDVLKKEFKPAQIDKIVGSAKLFSLNLHDVNLGVRDDLAEIRGAWQKDPQHAGLKLAEVQKSGGTDDEVRQAAEKLFGGLKTKEARSEAMKTLYESGGPKAMADLARQMSARGLESGEFRQFLKDLGGQAPSGKTYLAEILANKSAAKDFGGAVSTMLDSPVPGANATEKKTRLDSAMRDLVVAAGDDPKAKAALKGMLTYELSGDKRGPGDWSDKNKDDKLAELGSNRDEKFKESQSVGTKASHALEKASEFESTLKKMSQSVTESNAKSTFEDAIKLYGELELSAKAGLEAKGSIPAVGELKASVELSARAKISAGYDTKKAYEEAYKEAFTQMDEATKRAKDSLKSTVAREEVFQKSFEKTGTLTSPAESQFEAVQSVLRDKLRALET